MVWDGYGRIQKIDFLEKKQYNSKMNLLLILIGLFLLPTISNAAFDWSIISSEMYPKFESGDLEWSDIIAFILHLIQILIEAAGVVSVLLLMYGGFQMIFGSFTGDTESPKNTFKYTLIGFSIIIFAWIIVDLLVAFLTS